MHAIASRSALRTLCRNAGTRLPCPPAARFGLVPHMYSTATQKPASSPEPSVSSPVSAAVSSSGMTINAEPKATTSTLPASGIPAAPVPEPTTAAEAGTASTPSSQHAAEATEERRVAPPRPSTDAWERAGINPSVAERLVSLYPDAAAPTPAQRAFLLATLRGDVDVYLKDYMGRGKTFSLVLAAITLALRGKRAVLLFPTPHLVQQVSDLLAELSPEEGLHDVVTPEGADWTARLLVATPKALLAADPPALDVTHILLDEPDTMLGVLPRKHVKKHQLNHQPINLHPPPVVGVLNRLLGIKTGRDGWIDFSGRNSAHTVWASATLNPAVRRFVYGRGWVRSSGGKGVVDLNFTADASERQQSVRAGLDAIAVQAAVPSSRAVVGKPVHYAFSVDARGDIHPLPEVRMHRYDIETGNVMAAGDGAKKDRTTAPSTVPTTVIEALAFLHTSSPPPPGTYAVVLPPGTSPLRAVAEELAALGIPTAPLVPEALAGGVPIPDTVDGVAPVLLSSRAAMPGLHLPGLHTVYLLNGLDLSGLTRTQRKQNGAEARETYYSIVAGRMGRMGTNVVGIPGHPQRVISLTELASDEEAGMQDLFAGVRSGGNPQFALSEWKGPLDVRALSLGSEPESEYDVA